MNATSTTPFANLISKEALQKKLDNPPIFTTKIVNLTGKDLTIFTGTPARPLYTFQASESILEFKERSNRRRVEVLSIEDKLIDVWCPYNLKVSDIPKKYHNHDILVTRCMAEILTRELRFFRKRILCPDTSIDSCVFHPQTGALIGVRRLSVLNTVPLIV